MRDIAITLVVFFSCIYTLKKPYVGILLWSWLGYMNPHKLAYGFSYSMPFSQITAILTIGIFVFSKEKEKVQLIPVIVVWITFVLFCGLTTLGAYYPEEAFLKYKDFLKVQLMTFMTMTLIVSYSQLRQLIWVIVLSLGYFSVKGGIFTIMTLGSFRVWGPPGTFIEDNNALAVAILMAISLMFFLYETSKNKVIKIGLLIAVVLSLFTVFGSQSRGALLAISAVGLMYWWQSKRKVFSGVLILIFSIAILNFMPESWFSRMETINTYDQDKSAMGRLNAWEYAFNSANQNFLGMGFDNWSFETFLMYAPDASYWQSAHSIYFSILGDHGWVGLILYLTIWFLLFKKVNTIIKDTKYNSDFHEYFVLASMLKVGLIAYMVGGAFLSIAYFDLPWCFIAITILLDRFLDKDMAKYQKKIEVF